MRATGIVRRMDDLGRVVIYHTTPIKNEIEKLKDHIQDYYECNDNFTQKQINEFNNTLSTIQKAFKDKE